MQLPLCSLLLAAHAVRRAGAFAPLLAVPSRALSVPSLRMAETDVEALMAKVRALREAAKAGEDELQSDLFQKKKTKNDATDLIVDQLFPTAGEGGTAALAARLRERKLAAGMLVQVVERIHEREVAARGLEHVETAVKKDQVTFERVAKEDEAELARVRGLVDRLIVAAEVLDKEFLAGKGNEKITNADMTHWGGGNTAGLLKEKAQLLGREHDPQFVKRQQEFFDAATRTHTRDEFHQDSWQDSWKTVDESSLKKKDKKKKK